MKEALGRGQRSGGALKQLREVVLPTGIGCRKKPLDRQQEIRYKEAETPLRGHLTVSYTGQLS